MTKKSNNRLMEKLEILVLFLILLGGTLSVSPSTGKIKLSLCERQIKLFRRSCRIFGAL